MNNLRVSRKGDEEEVSTRLVVVLQNTNGYFELAKMTVK